MWDDWRLNTATWHQRTGEILTGQVWERHCLSQDTHRTVFWESPHKLSERHSFEQPWDPSKVCSRSSKIHQESCFCSFHLFLLAFLSRQVFRASGTKNTWGNGMKVNNMSLICNSLQISKLWQTISGGKNSFSCGINLKFSLLFPCNWHKNYILDTIFDWKQYGVHFSINSPKRLWDLS